MNSGKKPLVYEEDKSTALIIPQYTYDAKTCQLLQTKNNNEFDKIVNRVSFKNGDYYIEDADQNDISISTTSKGDSVYDEAIPHFIGNARNLTSIYSALYENQAFSHIIYRFGDTVLVGDEMKEDILSHSQQLAILRSNQNTFSHQISNESRPLLENTPSETINSSQYALITRDSKNRRLLPNYGAHVVPLEQSDHTIIINDNGIQMMQHEMDVVNTNKPIPNSDDPKPTPKSCWDHVLVWSIDDRFCIVETDYPVFRSSKQPSTAVHVHRAETSFTENETLELYLNNIISSAQQVVIYHIDNNSPKYISVVKTEDIPTLPSLHPSMFHPSDKPCFPGTSSSAGKRINVDALHSSIKSLMDFLTTGCGEDRGSFWIYKEEGDTTVKLINLSQLFGNDRNIPDLSMSEEEKRSAEIRWKYMAVTMCSRYASMLDTMYKYSDINNQTQRYLLINSISLLQSIVDLCGDNISQSHHYHNLLISKFEEVGDSAMAYCMASHIGDGLCGVFRDDITPSTVLASAYDALNFYNTACVMIHDEVEALSKEANGVSQQSVISRMDKYNRILVGIIKKLDLYLEHTLLYSSKYSVFTYFLRDINTYLSCRHRFGCILQEDDKSLSFCGEMVLQLYRHVVTCCDTVDDIIRFDQYDILKEKYGKFINKRGRTMNYCPLNAIFSLLLLSLSFFSPSSPTYAATLNEMGRFLQSASQNHMSEDHTDNFIDNKLFVSSAECYESAVELFQKQSDAVNCGMILCNLAKLLRQPFTERLTMSEKESKWVFSRLRWMNGAVDAVLKSNCDATVKQSLLGEFGECQIQLVHRLLEAESHQVGTVIRVIGNYGKLRNVLDYCENLFEMTKDEKKIIAVKFLTIQYYAVVIKPSTAKLLPNRSEILMSAYDVFLYMKENNIYDAVRVTDWMCQILLLYSYRDDYSITEMINSLEEVVTLIKRCSPLFLSTNYDNKLDLFNQVKKQFINMILRIMKITAVIDNDVVKNKVDTRCRRCIKIFNNDDFYFFFKSMEEEVELIFSSFRSI